MNDRFRQYGVWLVACITVLNLISCAGVPRVPVTKQYNDQIGQRIEPFPGYFEMPYGKLQRNEFGLWELYVSGDPLERGLTIGRLTKELLDDQEEAFVSQVQTLVPSRFHQWLLRGFLKIFNRRLSDHVPIEYQTEIYGIAQAASDRFDFLAPAFPRLLYYHGAHDIGHALQDLALVGCSSFAAWGRRTVDGNLLIGRNFDFYAGDDFAENKVIAFIKPDRGYRHVIVTWPGMIGAVSGMNEQGLTVTINAGKSSVPIKAKTPISLVTREILQYASNIEEAIRLARLRDVFVAESIMVGSAADRKAILIEVSPRNFGVYELPDDEGMLICTNHFQSEPYRGDKRNLRYMEESHSRYRFDRLRELLDATPKITPTQAAGLLRNYLGIGGKSLGYGNEKAINQLLAHHAVIFKPEERLLWVSAPPYQLGSFVAYDLNTIFARLDTLSFPQAIDEIDRRIPADPFIFTESYANYELYRQQAKSLERAIAEGRALNEDTLRLFRKLNPDFWKTYFLLGEYYASRKQYREAEDFYRMAASREVSTEADRRKIAERLRKCSKMKP